MAFENVAKLYVLKEGEDKDDFRFIIVLKKPCKVFRKKLGNRDGEKNKYAEVLSPFAYHPFSDCNDDEYCQKVFFNYYNLQQVISVKGKLQLDIDIDKLVEELRDTDKIGKIHYIKEPSNKIKFLSTYDLQQMH